MDLYSIIMLVVMIALFYFLMIRPENKRKKAAQEMRDALKKGDSITTIGGMKGKVVAIMDETVVFETSEDRVRIEIAKWGISSNDTAAAAAAAAAAEKKNAKAAAKTETETKVEE
ncbi:MAG: preprotein translocase subunit YajC [Oscillospiraceae bacterium]|nr:preprotein translocase subunit YajC [Oscillospiraceae bacterium]